MWSLIPLLLAAPAHAAIRGSGNVWDPSRLDRTLFREPQAAPLLARSNGTTPGANTSSPTTYRYRTNSTEPFLVTSLPDVTFDFGELYAGSIAIDPKNASESLFFVFAPKIGEECEDITIWLNGGPGCSSLMGWLQENGPVSWQPGTYAPVKNPYSWTNLTNMIWIEQPIGTGFSLGTPFATNEDDIAQPFIKWFKEFQNTFGIKNYKVYVTGESYAGRYVPYISAAMLDAKDREYYDLKGALMYDPCIGEFGYGGQVAAYPHLEANRNIWGLNDTFMADLASQHESCGYREYNDKYLTFPPSGNQPPTFNDYRNATCDVMGLASGWAVNVNPCFNPYQIVEQCPMPYDVLGNPSTFNYTVPGTKIYFQRPEVIEAIHAPKEITQWSDCAKNPVFTAKLAGPQQRGDTSPDPIQGVLPQIIEATNRVLVANGDWDFVIITNTTMLAIQNMTWNGELGFQEAPSKDFIVEQEDLAWQQVYLDTYGGPNTGPQGVMGKSHFERGLMWVENYMAGHMVPMYQPRAAYKQLQWVLGHIDEL